MGFDKWGPIKVFHNKRFDYSPSLYSNNANELQNQNKLKFETELIHSKDGNIYGSLNALMQFLIVEFLTLSSDIRTKKHVDEINELIEDDEGKTKNEYKVPISPMAETILVAFPRFVDPICILGRLESVVIGEEEAYGTRILHAKAVLYILYIWVSRYVYARKLLPKHAFPQVYSYIQVIIRRIQSLEIEDPPIIPYVMEKLNFLLQETFNNFHINIGPYNIKWRVNMIEGSYINPDDVEFVPPVQVFGVSSEGYDPTVGTRYQPPQPRINKGIKLLGSPESYNIWDFSLLEIARQMTIIDHRLFASIPIEEFYDQAFGKPRHAHCADNIRAFIDRFDAVSSWVCHSILHVDGHSEGRLEMYCKFAELSWELYKLNNLSSSFAIVVALQKGMITRLSLMESIPANIKDITSTITEIGSAVGSYKCYRSLIEKIDSTIVGSKEAIKFGNTAIVPHMVIHLSDLQQTEEGNEDLVDPIQLMASNSTLINNQSRNNGSVSGSRSNGGSMLNQVKSGTSISTLTINFNKWDIIKGCLLSISKIQSTKYHLEPVRVVAACINCKLSQFYFYDASEAEKFNSTLSKISFAKEPHNLSSVSQKTPSSPGGGRNASKSVSRSYSQDSEEGDIAPRTYLRSPRAWAFK